MKRKNLKPLKFIKRVAFSIIMLAGAMLFPTEDITWLITENAGFIEAIIEGEREPETNTVIPELTLPQFDLSMISPYKNSPYIMINNNIPFFTDEQMTTVSFEIYSELDKLGRCGVCFVNVGTDTMPTEERGEIGQVKPSGWQLVKYDNVDGNYLYNRCHLIGFQLTGENANVQNLITGTRYLNIEGMLPFENEIANYVRRTGNHVLYRVTPVFEDNNLLASGVLLEAKSVEDNGEGVQFCVYCYNVQPDIEINYKNGESRRIH